MKLAYLQYPTEDWYAKLEPTKEYPRAWITIVDIEVTLSNGYVLKRDKGCIWDGASIPKYLWWLLKPMDEASLGDWIHDELWGDKEEQLKLYDYSTYDARKFADDERLRWRKAQTDTNKVKLFGKTIFSFRTNVKNYLTHYVIRGIGGLFYSKQLKIPT